MLSHGIIPFLPIFTLANCMRGKAVLKGLPWWLSGKESACQCRRCRRCGFDPFVGKIPGRRKWQPTPVFLPGKSRGQRSLAGYSPEVAKESDVPEHTRTVGFSTFSLSWDCYHHQSLELFDFPSWKSVLINQWLTILPPPLVPGNHFSTFCL